MALLNLKKKEEEAPKEGEAGDKPADAPTEGDKPAEAPAEGDPPEELPSLPDDEPKDDDEAPKEEAAAPDELPAINKPPAADPPEEKPAEAPTEKPVEKKEEAGGKESYFGELSKSFAEGNKADIEEKLLLGDPLKDIKSFWNKKKLKDKVADIDSKIAEKMKPLRELEDKWQILNIDISKKKQELSQVETDIQTGVKDLKEMLAEADKTHKELKKKSSKK